MNSSSAASTMAARRSAARSARFDAGFGAADRDAPLEALGFAGSVAMIYL
jgi:hypothetical protein